MTTTIDAATATRLLPWPALIDALQAAFAVDVQVPPRHVHVVDSAPDAPAFTSLLMPAWTGAVLPAGARGPRYGVKIVNIAPGNAARGLPGLHSSYLLHDGTSGAPLLLVDGDVITSRRTAAASALAARWLAPVAAQELLVVGAGRVAALLPGAYAAVRPIRRVRVWSRHAQAAQALAAGFARDGFDAVAVDDLERACASAHIVTCATLACEPVVRGAWLRPGSHLDLIGSFTPQMREADDACLADADVWVDTLEALAKSGDLLGPIERGAWRTQALRGTLASLSRDGAGAAASARRAASGRTVFKSVGTALEDLAAAMLVEAGLAASR